MDAYLETIFVSQLSTDVAIGLAAGARLNAAMAAKQALPAVSFAIEIVRAAGAVSRMFWPYEYTGKKPDKLAKAALASKRSEHLRNALGVTNDNILKSMEMRHNIEHLDERLDAWAAEGTRQIYSYSVIDPAMVDAEAQSVMIFVLDPVTLTLHFRGEKFALRAIHAALDALRVVLSDRQEELAVQSWKETRARQGNPVTDEEEKAHRAFKQRCKQPAGR